MAVNYGVDIGTWREDGSDLRDDFAQISGERAVAEAVARLWSTPRGTLVTDKNLSVDIFDLLQIDFDQMTLNSLSSILKSEALSDDRVEDITVVVEKVSEEEIRISGFITPSQGPTFPFVLSVSGVTFALLEPAQ